MPSNRTGPDAPAPAAFLASLASLLLVLALAGLGCGGEGRPGDHPRVVLVSIDTLNLLYTDLYGEATGLTPRLAEMAAGGTLLEEAHTPVPLTLPSHAGMLSGRLPWETGVMLNGDPLPEDIPLLQEVLGEHGYRTGAVLGASVLDRRNGLARGFDHYDDRIGQDAARPYRTAEEVTDRAVAWVDEHRGEPFFLWVHYFDPHEPYVAVDAPPDTRLLLDGEEVASWTLAQKVLHNVELRLSPGRHRLTWEPLREPHPSDGPDTRLAFKLQETEGLSPFLAPGQEIPEGFAPLKQPRTLELLHSGSRPAEVTFKVVGRLEAPQPPVVDPAYRQEVAFVDRHLGRLVDRLRELGLDGDTLWVVVSDHGEGIWRRRGRGHAQHTFEIQLRTLWLLRGPGIPAGRRVADAPVLLTDLAPTVLDLLGLPYPDRIPGDGDGRSQTGCWSEGGCQLRREWWAYGARQRGGRVTSAAGYRWPWKALSHPRAGTALYDLAADAWERQPLAAESATAVKEQHGDRAAGLLRRLPRQHENFQRMMVERQQRTLGEMDREILEALGYL